LRVNVAKFDHEHSSSGTVLGDPEEIDDAHQNCTASA